MGGVPGWFDVASMCRHGDGFYDNEAAVSPTTFRVLWKGAMEVSQECNAVNSLTDAYFVQVLYLCLITDYFDTVRLFSTLKRG